MNNAYKKNCVVICGPTASGKTHLAVQLSLRYNGEIISADSRQVYRGMDIGTGKDLNEYTTATGSVATHLIDIKEPSDIYTVYHFKEDFFKTVEKIYNRNHLPFLTGGTGLYIESVLRNFDIPQVAEHVEFRKQCMIKDKDELCNELKKHSPELYERTDLSSKKRIVRALEIALFGPDIRSLQKSEIIIRPLNPLVLCTRWDRTVLHNRIDKRLDDRIKSGMIDEVKNLMESGVPTERLVQLGMEYKHIAFYLNGHVSLEQTITTLKQDIHRLAKRQETWFRGMERRGIAINWIDNADFGIAEKILHTELGY